MLKTEYAHKRRYLNPFWGESNAVFLCPQEDVYKRQDIEREAMAAIIPWKQMDMTLADMAWNGVEGLEKIRMHRPDVVITDIKMPVMNGIELIREAQKISPLTVFVVLSGYGEFEYTSQAMELGIRHYILKPCDETQMVEVLQKVKEELASREQKQKSEQEYQHTMRRLVPYAKGQICLLYTSRCV